MALSQREKMLLAVPVLVGALMAHYTWVHEPLFTRRAVAMELNDQMQAELAREQSKLMREGDLSLRRQSISAREQVIDAWVPGHKSAALLIWYLSQAERKSGAMIRSIEVGEKMQVTAGTAGEGETGTESDPAPTLTMIRLELSVDARFLEHLLFNQMVEQMPLFLNTDALSLAREGELPLEEAGELIGSGDPWSAARLLGESPTVSGSYQINLYFKQEKTGPSTDPMTFAQPSGRIDPFVMADLDEFLRVLLEHYNGEQWGGDGYSDSPSGGNGKQSGQLG